MSSSAEVAAIVRLYDILYSETFCLVAASVVFIYDTFVTFEREVRFIWTIKGSGASYLFFANKWTSMLLSAVAGLAAFSSFTSDESCTRFVLATSVFQVMQYVPGAVFSALRAYALSMSKVLGLLIFVLSLAPVGANLVRYGYQLHGEILPPFGCLQNYNLTEALQLRLIIASRVPLVIADALLIYITWAKLGSRDAMKSVRQSRRPSLADVLFRDGTMFFLALFSLNIVHLICSATAVAGDNKESFVTIFTGPLSAILVSRFLLALQEANRAVLRVDSDDPLCSSRDPYSSMPSFISSLGAFVDPNLQTTSDDDCEWDVDEHSAGEEELRPGISDGHV